MDRPARFAPSWFLVLALPCLAACGDEALSGDTTDQDTAIDVDTAPPDTETPEVIVFDTGDPDTADTSVPDTADTDTGEVQASCSDPLKPYLCPCDTNSQCESSLCIAVDEEEVARRCTISCFGDIPCPNGWECKGVGIGQEQQLICLPPVNTLCEACERSADCQKVGALCIDFPDGRFCGQDCQNAPNSCPSGYACQEVLNELGQIDGYQCMRTSGSCNCPDGTDYQNDPNNCSFCGNVCSFGGAEAGCQQGACFLKNCLSDWKNLNEVESDGCEYRCTFQSAEDWPDAACDAVNGCDQNCDGIDGDFARGIFVSATGANNAAGTPYDPVRTIAEGLAKAAPGGRDHVYVAAGTYNEVVTLKKGVSIFGGYSNDGKWARNLTLHKTQITSSTGASSIRVVIADGIDARTVLDGVEVLAGTNANPGGSSYAIWIKDSTEALELVRVTAIGGNGGAGANGADGSKGNDGETGSPGTSPQDYECWCEDYGNLVGGPPGNNSCPSGTSAAGGRGGHVVEDNSCDVARNTGNPGQPSAAGTPGGLPENVGSSGGSGPAGQNGAGGNGGTVNGSGFWTGRDGESGAIGGNGAGGGGGGSGKTRRSNNYRCGFTNTFWWGGGGGGGGSGGCGGGPATPGRSGGSSFGVFLFNSSPRIAACSFGHKNGGNGGRGGDGGAPGIGKDGGAGGRGYDGDQDGTNGAKGGKGGDGGRGGHGGGGAGGVAFGLYLHGNSNPTCQGVTFDPAGSGGAGGLGGASSGNSGGDGESGDRFGASAACP